MKLYFATDHPDSAKIGYIRDDQELEIAVVYGASHSDLKHSTARRMVGVFNACVGLNPEQIPNIVSSLSYLEQQLDNGEPTEDTDILTLRFTEEFRTAFKQMLANLKTA